jgi:hypothetical protein
MMLRRLGLAALAAALLLLQPAGFVHALEHYAEVHQDADAGHDPHCEKCDAYAAAGGTLPAAPLLVIAAFRDVAVALPALPLPLTGGFSAYLSRAPPRALPA